MWACKSAGAHRDQKKNVGSLQPRLKAAVSHLGRALGQIAGPLRAEPSLSNVEKYFLLIQKGALARCSGTFFNPSTRRSL